jgi:hypothetical protein
MLALPIMAAPRLLGKDERSRASYEARPEEGRKPTESREIHYEKVRREETPENLDLIHREETVPVPINQVKHSTMKKTRDREIEQIQRREKAGGAAKSKSLVRI